MQSVNHHSPMIAQFSARSSLIFFGLLVSAVLSGATVPSTLPLIPRAQQAIDPELGFWLKAYSEGINPKQMNRDELARLLSELTPLESITVKLYLLANQNQNERAFQLEREAFLNEARRLFEQELRLSPDQRSPLTGDAAVLFRDVFDKDSEQVINRLIDQSPVYSCSHKSQMIAQAKKIQTGSHDDEFVLSLIKRSKEYDSLMHRRQLLDAIASNIPVKRRDKLAGPLREAGENLTLLFRRHAWLQTDENESGSDASASVRKFARKKDCDRAQSEFERNLKNAQSGLDLKATLEMGSAIEQCHKSKNRSSVLAFWQKVRPDVELRFGEVGVLSVDTRIGYYYWSRDQNKEAFDIYKSVFEKSKSLKDAENIYAKSMFTLGRIAENSGDISKAIDYFSSYISENSSGEDFETALSSFVVARASKGQWQELSVSLKNYLDQQALISLDQRPTSNMSFSLFWLGRAYLSLGKLDLAREMWRRLAAEYYSTFYGALGHFLLEKTSGRTYALEPSRVRGFKFDPLLKSLSPKQQDVAHRTLALLRLGMYDVARCEAEELNISEKAPADVMLVRSLLLHASGAWLDAIKIYDALPRSVRASLPVGFERILFPRKYSDMVNHYSQKLRLDSDLVFAVMRQESVFANEAMSPVGAMGLMQLMPATASIELRNISKGYLPQERRSELSHLLHNDANLLDPELNVTLGVHHLNRLLQIYKSPVFALTAYNASPAATIKWRRTIASDDLLIFIERIPYKETRNYVKLVMRNYFYYKRWYGPSIVSDEIHLEAIAEDLLAEAKKAQKS